MDIRVFDKELTALGMIDEMVSLIWSIHYFNVGEFKVLAPITDNNKDLLVVGNIIIKHDEYVDYIDGSDNTWRRAAEITYVHYTRSSEGQEQIEASGSMLGSWLNQRVINPQIQLNGTCQAVVNRLISRNIGTNATASRKFPQFEMLTQADLGGTSFDYSNEEYKALGDEVRDVCQQGKIGYDLLVCEKTKKYGFYLYDGEDLTADNASGNAPCIFSRDFDNVNEQEYEDDYSNIKNHAIVQGAPDDSDVKEVVEVDIGGTSGLALKEVYIDASSISRRAENSSGTQEDIPVATYRAMLTSQGKTDLAQMIEAYSFNSSVNLASNLRYKEDFDLGDRVTCIDRSWGITINSRITEIIQTFEAGKKTIEATFGESAPTLLDKIKKVR